MSKGLTCKNCGSKREVGRKLCKPCNSKRVQALNRYTWTLTCVACQSTFEGWRKSQTLCKGCRQYLEKIRSLDTNTNNYVYTKTPGITEHRKLAEDALGRGLESDEVVHHIDNNPKNNANSNLLLISRKDHGKLHQFLDLQRVIFEKSKNENQGNCWNNLIVPMTTAWCENTGANVLKLSEIGQSAAEPLQPKSYGEGSETCAPDI